MPAVVHNLEARDDDFINYILSNITLGYNDMFIYEELPNNKVRVVGHKGNLLLSSISIEVPDHMVAEIGPNIFYNIGENLTTITIPDSVEIISNEAFIGLPSLEEVVISSNSNLTYIGDSAFADCANLSKFGSNQGYLNIPDGVTYVGDFSFYGTDFNYINIGSSLNELGESAFSNIVDLQNIFVDSDNLDYYSNNGVLFSYDGSLFQYPTANNSTHYSVPNLINHILPCAFMNSSLSTIYLNDIETIGINAFKGCSSLTVLEIPYSVQNIGNFAFEDCSSLYYVEVDRVQAPITSVGYGAFDNCHSTLQIEVPKNRIGDYKNKLGWNRYKTKVVPDSSTFPSYTIYDNSNITFSDSISAGLNKLYRLDVVDEYYYGIKATASYNALIELYDSNMSFIDSDLGKLSEVLDSNTTYYVSISFESANNSGTISTQIKHFHDYDDHYVWQSLTEHKAYCYCMDYDLDPHVVSPDAFQGGLPRARCLLCNGFASFGGTWHDGIGGFPYTLNGSFILPNGVIVLEEADMEAYLNGTLVFINPNENIDRGNNHIPCIIKREDE